MRRGFLTLLILLGGASAAWAQARPFPGPGTTDVKVSADDVVARIMTFDQNSDGRVAIAELSERMHPLMERGDRNGDGTLDQTEIRALADARSTPAQVIRQIAMGSGGYAFGDDAGLSSRMHIEGALEDLRLTSDKTERALPIIRSYVEQMEAAARADVLSQVEPLLTPEQLQAFSTALFTQQRRVVFRINGSDVRVYVRAETRAGDQGRRRLQDAHPPWTRTGAIGAAGAAQGRAQRRRARRLRRRARAAAGRGDVRRVHGLPPAARAG
jgi:hypothetical protein